MNSDKAEADRGAEGHQTADSRVLARISGHESDGRERVPAAGPGFRGLQIGHTCIRDSVRVCGAHADRSPPFRFTDA